MKRIFVSLACLAVFASPTLADGDAAKGEKVFKQCQACHSVADATNKVGPYLVGVVGRTPGTAEGFNYSDAMKQFGADGNVWDVDKLKAYLANPKEFLPGNKMSFAGLKKEDQIEDVIAFLKTKM